MATAARYPKTVYANTGMRNVADYAAIEKRSAQTRYKYAKPTEKAQHGLAKQLHTEIQTYELPITDVDTDRRNFPGYTESNPYSLADIQKGDWSGTTDTDSATDVHGNNQRMDEWSYTRINQKSGSKGRSWPSSSPRRK